jgi:hypothetical protein
MLKLIFVKEQSFGVLWKMVEYYELCDVVL